MRFLVTDGRQQPPVFTGFLAGFLKPLAERRQAFLDVFHIAPRTDIVEVGDIAIVMVEQLFQPSRLVYLLEVLTGLVQQAGVFARRESPGQRFRCADVKGNPQLRVKAPVDGDFIGVRHGVVDHLFPHQVE